MNAYLWDRLGRPVSRVTVEEPIPREVTIVTKDPRFDRIFWRCQGRTLTMIGDNPELPFQVNFIGMDYEEGEESPRRVSA